MSFNYKLMGKIFFGLEKADFKDEKSEKLSLGFSHEEFFLNRNNFFIEFVGVLMNQIFFRDVYILDWKMGACVVDAGTKNFV